MEKYSTSTLDIKTSASISDMSGSCSRTPCYIPDGSFLRLLQIVFPKGLILWLSNKAIVALQFPQLPLQML